MAKGNFVHVNIKNFAIREEDECILYPHFIFDPDTGMGTVFLREGRQVRYLKESEGSDLALVYDYQLRKNTEVRKIQLFPPLKPLRAA